jgi:hypothetical protein
MRPTFEFHYNGCAESLGFDDEVPTTLRVCILKQHLTRCELLEEFEHFMKGCGYYFSDDECIAITSKENV